MATGSNQNITAFFKESPIFAGIFALLISLGLIGIVTPPRKRKYRPKRNVGRKRRKGYRVNPGNPGSRKKKAKKSKKSTRQPKAPKTKRVKRSTGRKRSVTGSRPARMVKGSKAAKDFMAKLRAMRKK